MNNYHRLFGWLMTIAIVISSIVIPLPANAQEGQGNNALVAQTTVTVGGKTYLVTDNASQIAAPKLYDKEFEANRTTVPTKNLEPQPRALSSDEVNALVANLALTDKVQTESQSQTLEDGWFHWAIIDEGVPHSWMNAYLISSGGTTSGRNSFAPIEIGRPMHLIQHQGGVDVPPSAERRISFDVVVNDGCSWFEMFLWQEGGNTEQYGGHIQKCANGSWTRYIIPLPKISGRFSIIFKGQGNFRVDRIAASYRSNDVYMPFTGKAGNACPLGYVRHTSDRQWTGIDLAQYLYLEVDDVVDFEGKPILGRTIFPEQVVCRMSDHSATYIVWGGVQRVDLSDGRPLGIARSSISGRTPLTVAANVTALSRGEFWPIGRFVGFGNATLIALTPIAAGFATYYGWQMLADNHSFGALYVQSFHLENLETAEILGQPVVDHGPALELISWVNVLPNQVWYRAGLSNSPHEGGILQRYVIPTLLQPAGFPPAIDIYPGPGYLRTGPISAEELGFLLATRIAVIPPPVQGMPDASDHVRNHPSGPAAIASRTAIWRDIMRLWITDTGNMKCWERPDGAILLFHNAAKVIYSTGGVVRNVGVLTMTKAFALAGGNTANPPFQSTSLTAIHFDDGKPPVNRGTTNGVNEIPCPDPRDPGNWPFDGLTPAMGLSVGQ